MTREFGNIRMVKYVTWILSSCMTVSIIYICVYSRKEILQGHELWDSTLSSISCNRDHDAIKQMVHHKDAKCIDGSSPAYYFRKALDTGDGKNKWHIHFEGGGWPYNLHESFLRSKTDLGSSKKYPECLKFDTFKFTESQLKSRNPLMHDWNMVHVKYCDGGSYAGDAVATYEGANLYFKGKAIRDAIIHQLLERGMASATDVLISGCSAGGLGIYLGLDSMAEIIHTKNPNVKVRGLSDSGYFGQFKPIHHFQYRKPGDRENAIIDSNLNYAGAMRHIYSLMNISAGVHSKCRQSKRDDSDCIFAESNAPFIQTPMFALQPKFDRWQLWHILGTPFDAAVVNEFGNSIFKQINDILLDKPQHGAFFDSCAHHCMSCSSSSEDPWNGEHIKSIKDSLTPAEAFKKWYNDLESLGDSHLKSVSKRSPSLHLYAQNQSYPCNDCCICVI